MICMLPLHDICVIYFQYGIFKAGMLPSTLRCLKNVFLQDKVITVI